MGAPSTQFSERAHATQFPLSSALNPGLHVHWLLLVAPAGADEFPGHIAHVVDPGKAAYEPLEQTVQTEDAAAPGSALYVPVAHWVHASGATCATPVLKLPASHTLHARSRRSMHA